MPDTPTRAAIMTWLTRPKPTTPPPEPATTYHTVPTFCPRCNIYGPATQSLTHRPNSFAIKFVPGKNPPKPDSPPIVRYCADCAPGGVPRLKTGMALHAYLREAGDEAYTAMVQRAVELAKSYSALTANSSARQAAEEETGRGGRVARWMERVRKWVRRAPASKKATPPTSRLEIEVQKAERERQQMATINREMKRMEERESEGERTARQREQAETDWRFRCEMEKLVMVGKMRLAGDAGWKNAVGEYVDDDGSDDGEGAGQGGTGRKRQAVRRVWYWLT